MEEKPTLSTWDRWNWNPIVPGLFTTIWLGSIARRDWDWNWFRIAGTVILCVWLIGAIYNWLSGGKVVDWLYSDDDDREFEVPRDFAEFQDSTNHESPLTKALSRGLAPSGDLKEQLDGCEVEEIDDAIDAMSRLSAYRGLIEDDDERASMIAEWFRQPGSEVVFGGFFQEGMPLVHERLKALLERESEEDSFRDERLLLIGLLFGYGYQMAMPEIEEAAKDPGLCENYSWVRAFSSGNENDTDFVAMLQHLGRDLPEGFASVAFLDRCNEMCREHDMDPHPFSSDAGMQRLRSYAIDADPEHFSYARSSATALPHLSHPDRDALLGLLEKHPDLEVAAEAAWAGAKLEREASISRLIEMASDWRIGQRAFDYLGELELKNRIPQDSLESRHLARCAMADWLRHPHELAATPDQLEIVDHREIHWPPTEDRRRVTLLKWTLKDESGIGMTGGTTTWCFFSQDHLDQPVLDVYARHCNWELRALEKENAPESYDDLDYGRTLLTEANPGEAWTPHP